MPHIPRPTSHLPHSPLPALPDKQDRDRLTLLFRTHGDTVSFIGSLDEDNPLDVLAWLDQPHIKPWREAIAAAYRENRQADTQRKLSRCLGDVTRILDLEADSTLRIRAVNAVIRLANAIHRGNRVNEETRRARSASEDHLLRTRSASEGLPAPTRSATADRAAKELYFAQERVADANCMLNLHLERRANRTLDLEDVQAPIGTTPSWARGDPIPKGKTAAECAPLPNSNTARSPDPHTNGAAPSTKTGRTDQTAPTAHLNGHAIENRKSEIENARGCPKPPARKRKRRPPPRHKPRAP